MKHKSRIGEILIQGAKSFTQFFAIILGDIVGQILTVIGFFMLLGGVAASTWGMAVAGAVLLVLGFFLFSNK